METSLERFIDSMDGVVSAERSAACIALAAETRLHNLLTDHSFLTNDQRAADPNSYAQHLVHIHPQGKYSIVSLVWLPGQQTPIHDHTCWCVVGVLEGSEHETRYGFWQGSTGPELTIEGTTLHEAGDVCRLVPPEENIHKVANAGDGVAISIHVYGADIAKLGTSINQTFDHEVKAERSPQGVARSWRNRH